MQEDPNGSHTHGLTRRGFLHCSACAAATMPLGAGAGAAMAGGSEKLREFPYGAVRLTGGPLKDQFDRLHAHYLALDDDRLLKGFRQHVGLPAPGPDMGGWYDPEGFVPALTFGQYVSGLARIGATTGDAACHAKVRRLVAGYGEMLARTKDPYAGPSSRTMWPAYVMDKYVVGLIDAYQLSGVEQAKALLGPTIDKCMPYISPVSRDRVGKKDPPYDETFVLPENLFTVAEITGERRFHDLAVRYLLDREWFDPLAAGKDVLPGKHAYSHTIALSSGGQAYLSLGDAKYRQALINAWQFMEQQRFASGGWGPEEQFVTPHRGQLGASLTNSTAHFETPCGAYADLKLARYLVRLTGDPRYADGLERTLYNTMLAVRLPDSDGDYPYYSSYGPRAAKEFYFKKWPCCSGTLVQGVADYVKNIYFHDDDAVWVNLYTPSTLDWARPGGRVMLEQSTGYPATDSGTLTVREAGGGAFAINLRVPAWAEGASVSVNGAPVAVAGKGHIAVHRSWSAGDRIEWRLSQPLRTLPIDDLNPNRVALMRGPVMYVGLDPWDELYATPVVLPGGLKPVSGQHDVYAIPVAGKDLVFVPYFTVQQQRYNTYFLKA